MKLLAELTETEFSFQLERGSGLAPARPQHLGAWKEPNLKPSLEKIAQAARLSHRKRLSTVWVQACETLL